MTEAKVHTLKPVTTLPAHEQMARRNRARILAFPKPAPKPVPARPANFHQKPNLLDPF